MRRLLVSTIAVLTLVAGACGGGGGAGPGAPGGDGDPLAADDGDASTTTSAGGDGAGTGGAGGGDGTGGGDRGEGSEGGGGGEPPPQGVFAVGEGGVHLVDSPGGGAVGHIREGVLLPYGERRDGFVRVTTPCENVGWAPLERGTAHGPYRVVIDPGHGGEEPGAVGPTGLAEAPLNLDIGARAIALLHERGIPAVLTRTQDYRATLAFRVRMAVDVGAEVFVSLHHNSGPDEHRSTPGTETFYQYRSDDSKRLTGLLQEEVYGVFDAYGATFGADYDAGAKYRLSSEGRDYYGVIRHSFDHGVAAALVEAAFISEPEEEALLRREEVRQREAEAIARGVERYFAGEEPGAVFTEPYPRSAPAGGGGGRSGCEDPA